MPPGGSLCRSPAKVDNGIAATRDDGIRGTLHLDSYDGKPELRAEGTCMRYRHNYGDAYDYMDDDNGDGTIDAYEQPNWPVTDVLNCRMFEL